MSLEVGTRPGRRSNVERTATTRRKVLESTIACLYEHGYNATTTAMIAQHAGVSRGALMHHFPTKVDLVLALIEHVVARQRAFYIEALRAYPKGRERFLAMTELTWRAWREPSGVAITEIMVAARSDRLLGDRLPGLFEMIETSQLAEMRTLARFAGITDDQAVETFSQLSAAAIRGLTIERVFRRDSGAVDRAMALLRDLKVLYADQLLTRTGERG
ncbi:TetR/AcrR family transcriptional regulator [Phenylobacterium sp. VNQ135]|uniref:TetR/AcrR family transcriptional regulator n=1 Tax=Phenylobacterium sp. VNQ135 TaxID=3400922 RepID=UPI003C0D5E85